MVLAFSWWKSVHSWRCPSLRRASTMLDDLGLWDFLMIPLARSCWMCDQTSSSINGGIILWHCLNGCSLFRSTLWCTLTENPVSSSCLEKMLSKSIISHFTSVSCSGDSRSESKSICDSKLSLTLAGTSSSDIISTRWTSHSTVLGLTVTVCINKLENETSTGSVNWCL